MRSFSNYSQNVIFLAKIEHGCCAEIKNRKLNCKLSQSECCCKATQSAVLCYWVFSAQRQFCSGPLPKLTHTQDLAVIGSKAAIQMRTIQGSIMNNLGQHQGHGCCRKDVEQLGTRMKYLGGREVSNAAENQEYQASLFICKWIE